MAEQPKDITRLLVAHGQGQKGAFDELVPLVYSEMRRIAQRQLRRHQPSNTLETTGLVHEAYLKMVDQEKAGYSDRGHFFAISAHAMRQILVDHARKRLAAKRGGGQAADTLDDQKAAVQHQADGLLAVHQVLDSLGEIDERLVKLVECRFFAGLTEEETAAALGISVRTVQRDWKRAKAWLREELGEGV